MVSNFVTFNTIIFVVNSKKYPQSKTKDLNTMASFCGFDSQELLPISLHPEIDIDNIDSRFKQFLEKYGFPCIIFTVAGVYPSRLVLNDEFEKKVYLVAECETYVGSGSTSLKIKDSNNMSPASLNEIAWETQHEHLHELFLESELEAAALELSLEDLQELSIESELSQDNSEEF